VIGAELFLQFLGAVESFLSAVVERLGLLHGIAEARFDFSQPLNIHYGSAV
jgi:hypothetical protein